MDSLIRVLTTENIIAVVLSAAGTLIITTLNNKIKNKEIDSSGHEAIRDDLLEIIKNQENRIANLYTKVDCLTKENEELRERTKNLSLENEDLRILVMNQNYKIVSMEERLEKYEKAIIAGSI